MFVRVQLDVSFSQSVWIWGVDGFVVIYRVNYIVLFNMAFNNFITLCNQSVIFFFYFSLFWLYHYTFFQKYFYRYYISGVHFTFAVMNWWKSKRKREIRVRQMSDFGVLLLKKKKKISPTRNGRVLKDLKNF